MWSFVAVIAGAMLLLVQLARAQGRLDVTASARYSTNRSTFDDTPVGSLTDRDRPLTFGVFIGLRVCNKNQGAKEEAALAITHAQRRREFQEQLVSSEVASREVHPRVDNMLKITSEGRKAALDMRLVKSPLGKLPQNKIDALVEHVGKLHQRTNQYRSAQGSGSIKHESLVVIVAMQKQSQTSLMHQ